MSMSTSCIVGSTCLSNLLGALHQVPFPNRYRVMWHLLGALHQVPFPNRYRVMWHPPHDGTPLSGPSKCRFQKNLEKTHSPPKLFRPKNSPGPKSAGQKKISFWKKFERCSAKIHVLCRSDNVRGMRKILVPVRNYVDRGSASRIYRFNKEKSLSFICSSNVVCMIVPKRRATSKPKLAILVPRSQGNAASSALG